MKAFRALLVVLASLLLTAQLWGGTVSFFDDFNNGPSPLWGNELGAWTTQNGFYFAQNPNNNPATYTSLPYALTDYTLDVDINGVSDGGIWLRTDGSSNTALVLIVGGWGHSYTGFYFHTVQNGNWSGPFNWACCFFNQGDNIHVQVVAAGNHFYVYVNGGNTPVDSVTYTGLASGYVGLYDFTGQGHYPINQSFDNFGLAGTTVPEPMTLLLLGGGVFAGYVRRKRNC